MLDQFEQNQRTLRTQLKRYCNQLMPCVYSRYDWVRKTWLRPVSGGTTIAVPDCEKVMLFAMFTPVTVPCACCRSAFHELSLSRQRWLAAGAKGLLAAGGYVSGAIEKRFEPDNNRLPVIEGDGTLPASYLERKKSFGY